MVYDNDGPSAAPHYVKKPIWSVSADQDQCTATEDILSAEVPLEIHIQYGPTGQRRHLNVAVTMRTPGHDEDLCMGFLLTEGIIGRPDALTECRPAGENRIVAALHPSVVFEAERLSRHVFATSACGICGKAAIANIHTVACYFSRKNHPRMAPKRLCSLPERLRAAQTGFDQTGGVHAAGLFNAAGDLLLLREDVGRHNAVDKVLGAAIRAGWPLPLNDYLLLVSGRAGFELVQKASMAGIGLMAAIGAPSALAVEMAESAGMTLTGFLRDHRFNIYCGAERIAAD
jgi:FdhD protein